jgi:CubicO group peptidase (beta-lactamase class C family)
MTNAPPTCPTTSMVTRVRVRSFLGALVMLPIGASALKAQSGLANPRRLDSLAGAPVLANRVVGLVAAVVKGNDTLLMKGYGKADVEWDVPMAADAMFEVGSIAKQFTAAAVLQLRDEGKVSLDDEITKWLPNLDMRGNKVTLRRMLSHTSGINHFSEPREFEVNLFIPGVPRDSAYRHIKLDPFQFPTGQAQAYNNSAFWLLGLVVEKASGMRYEDYVEKKIFEPLGMKRSMYCNSSVNVPRRAHGYGLVNGVIRRAPMVQYSWVFAPGAICSTAGDLVTWLKALHGGKVLTPKSYAEMTTAATLDDGTKVQYGLGIKVGEDYRGLKYIGHGGTAPGFRADAAWYPEAQLAVVVLTNTSPSNLVPAGLGDQLAREVLPWKRPEMKYYTGDASPFVGRYQHVVGGNQRAFFIDVTQTPTGLAFAPNGQRPDVLPWADGLTFYANEFVTLTFRRANGDSGPVTELRRDDSGNLYILKKQ